MIESPKLPEVCELLASTRALKDGRGPLDAPKTCRATAVAPPTGLGEVGPEALRGGQPVTPQALAGRAAHEAL